MVEASPLSELERKFARDFEGPQRPDAPVLGIALRLLAAGAGVIETCRLMMAEGETAKELELAADALHAVPPEHDWSSGEPPGVLVEQYFDKIEERDTQVMEKYQRALELHESRMSKLRDVPRFVARLTQGCDQLRAIIQREVPFPIDEQRRVLALIEHLKGSLQRGGRFPQEELLRVVRDLRALSVARGEGASPQPSAQPASSHTPSGVDALTQTVSAIDAEKKAELVFVKRGMTWEIVFGQESQLYPHRKGFGYIRELIRNEWRPVLSEQLEGGGPASTGDDALDPEARENLKLEAKRLAEAVKNHRLAGRDAEAKAGLEELGKIEAHIRQGTGLSGKSRKLGGEDKRVRQRVGKAIRDALDQLGSEMPKLAAHLEESIADPSGIAPCYRPVPPRQWLV